MDDFETERERAYREMGEAIDEFKAVLFAEIPWIWIPRFAWWLAQMITKIERLVRRQ